MTIDYEAIRNRWILEASNSDLGLWWLADDIRDVLGPNATEENIRAVTLIALKPLLESGKLRAVDITDNGKFKVWPYDVDQLLSKIAKMWKELGKPDIGDIVWFIGQRENQT